MKNIDKRAIEYVVAHLDNTIVAKIILFGSKARGDDDEESDIDLLIITNSKLSWHSECELLNIVHDAELKYGVIFGAIVFDAEYWRLQPDNSPFKQRIIAEGKAA